MNFKWIFNYIPPLHNLNIIFQTEPSVIYARKLEHENPKLPNKTCIMAQLKVLEDRIKDNHCIAFVHKAVVNPMKTSHR